MSMHAENTTPESCFAATRFQLEAAIAWLEEAQWAYREADKRASEFRGAALRRAECEADYWEYQVQDRQASVLGWANHLAEALADME